ncbi:MAG: thiol reductant exporter subunit CydC [Cyanobacteriota bacterium]|jgi:ABC-type multidrug transport system fused ATPase/permease subunit
MNSVLPLTSSSCGGMKPYVVANQSRLHKIFQAEIPKSDSPTHPGYGLGLRLLIQEHKNGKTSQQEPELETDPPNFRELLSENLTKELDEIISFIDQEAQSRSQGKKQALTLDDTAITEKIDAWTDKLITELNINNEVAKHDIQGQVDFFFSSLLDQKNSENFVKEVQEFFKTNPKASQERRNLIQDLSARYPIGPIQAKHLVDILEPDRLSLKQIRNALLYMAKEYRLLEKKGQMIGTCSKFAAAALSGSLAGYLNQSAIGSLVGNTLMRIQASLNNNAELSQIDLLQEIGTTLNRRIADALLMTEYSEIDESKFAEIHTKLTLGRDASYELMSDFLSTFLPCGFGLVGALAGMTALHPLLGAVSLSSVPFIVKKTGNFMREFQDLQKEQSEATQQSTQGIMSITTSSDDAIQSPTPQIIANNLAKSLNGETSINMKGEKLSQSIRLSFESSFWNAMVLSSCIGAGLWYRGDISELEVLASSSIAGRVQSPVLTMIGISNRFLRRLQQVQDMELLLQSGEKISLEQDAQKPGVDSLANHNLIINNLGFTGQDGTEIIKGINLNIPQGSFMTITGESGGGKSTLLRCLLGLYKPSSGSITIGGKPRDELKQNGDNSVKALISSCRQAPTYLPHLSLRDNLLLYSSVPAEDTRIKEVLTQLGLEKFTGKLDEKLAKPSGGEKVRIGLARALLRNNGENKILVLDEATTGVDAKTEKEIIDCLKNLQKTKPDLTIIWVTHSKQVVDAVNNNYNFEIR